MERRNLIHEKKESGQAIVLVAMLMVVLLGMLGLAIDGGGSYLLYRDVQNAVDSAAIAAAYSMCTNGDFEANALESARLNGFSNSDADVTVEVSNPPVHNAEHRGDDTMIEVRIVAYKPSYFIQLLWSHPIKVDVLTISQCDAGASASIDDDIVNRYAFRSLAGPGECTQTTSWNVAGTRWTVEGDIWMPNISGSPQFNNNQPNPETRDDPIDVLGNIYLGNSENSRFNDRHDANGSGLNEDVQGSAAANSVPGYTGHYGDGVLEYNVPAPDPLPFTMDYFRPLGSPLCSTSDYPAGECGTLQSLNLAVYHDISGTCDHRVSNHQDFKEASFTYYNDSTNVWQSGIYYTDCDLTLNDSNMSGTASFISEESIDLNNQPYNFTGYGDAPVFVTNHDNNRGNPAQCSAGGSYALQINANNSTFRGPVIAFRGTILIQGNDFLFESCISAKGFAQNGNTRAVYRCVPDQPTGVPSVGIIR